VASLLELDLDEHIGLCVFKNSECSFVSTVLVYRAAQINDPVVWFNTGWGTRVLFSKRNVNVYVLRLCTVPWRLQLVRIYITQSPHARYSHTHT
jgi:hypothetical protein